MSVPPTASARTLPTTAAGNQPPTALRTRAESTRRDKDKTSVKTRHWLLNPLVLLPGLVWAMCVGTGVSWQAVFTDSAWLLPMVICVSLVSVSAAGIRWLASCAGFSQTWSAAGSALALLLGLNWATRTPGQFAAGIIPTPASLSRLWHSLDQGLSLIRTLPTPTASTTILTVVVCLSVGVLAWLCDLVAITYKNPTLVGLLALVVFLIPSLLNQDGSSIWGFILGATFYLILVVASRSLAGWRVNLTLISGGTNVSFPSLLAGVLLPVLLAAGVAQAIPQLSSGLIDLDQRPKNRTVAVYNPIVDLRDNLLQRQTQTLYSYQDDTGQGQYLRLMGLDLFDGNQWNFTNPQIPEDQQIATGMPLDAHDSAVKTFTSNTRITVADLQSTWLPLPYVGTKASVSPAWIYDPTTRSVFSKEENQNTAGLGTYTVQRTQFQPAPEQLRAAGEPRDVPSRFLDLPADLPPSFAELARQHSRNQPTKYDQAVALQQWLREFTYDVRAPNNGTGKLALEKFFSTKRGFCVHFSSAMAVLARSLGIPSRVAVGYLPGTNSGHQWVVTNRDAHAWPELYFQGIGWVPFEPTPADRAPLAQDSTNAVNGTTATPEPAPGEDAPAPPSTPEPEQPGQAEQPGPEEHPAQPEPAPEASPENGPTPPSTPDASENQTTSAQNSKWLVRALLIALGILLLAGLMSLPRLLVWWLYRRRWAQAKSGQPHQAAAAAAQLRIDSQDFGQTWRAQETARQFTKRNLTNLKASEKERAAGNRLCQLIEQWQYAPAIRTRVAAQPDTALLRQGWQRRSSRWQRLRATWLPASLFTQLRQLRA